MTIELRPHHLLCILTYSGKGYSEDFTGNYDRVVARLNAGERIKVVYGPDVICAPLMAAEDDPHCLRASVVERDKVATGDLTALLRRPVVPGEQFFLDRVTVAALRSAFANGATRDACVGCKWSELCSSVAEKRFDIATLFPTPGVNRTTGSR